MAVHNASRQAWIRRFALFRYVSGGKGRAERCSSATGMQ